MQKNPWKGEESMININELENYFYVMGIDPVQTGLSAIVGLAGYILLALGLYTVAKRRGIRNSWLAWIPFGQSWMLGCVSDQYQHVAMGRKKNKRTLLLWLDVINTVMTVITVILLVRGLSVLFRYVDMDAFMLHGEEYLYGDMFEHLTDDQLMQIASAMIPMLLPALIMSGVTITLTVFKYIALYDLYRSCEPAYAAVYTVVSIVFGTIAMGVLVLLCRNKDHGMQPRQPFGYGQNGYLPPEQNWQPPQDPWRNNNQQW